MTVALSENGSPLRICDECGGVDDHPRHVIKFAAGDGVTPTSVAVKALSNAEAYGPDTVAAITAQVDDTTEVSYHMDCCRTRGCFDGSCGVVTEGATELRGDELRSHIQETFPEGGVNTLFEDPENPQPQGPPLPADVVLEREGLSTYDAEER
jgi:hypothetical protein